MFKQYYPHEFVESVFAIDYNKVFNRGYRGIIFDIDNTLVPHGEDSVEEIDQLFQQIHNIGLKTILLSNNSEERIQSFLENIDTLYIHDAQKPEVANYLRAVEMLGVKKEEALCIGDQVFTDIWGANKCGIDNVLVRYIGFGDGSKIGIKRNLEKIILAFYRLDTSSQNRIGDIFVEGGY